MTARNALLALSLSCLSDCTSSSSHAYEVAKLTFTYGGRIESFFGASAVPGSPLNITDYRLKVDLGNLMHPECIDRGSVCDSESNRYRYPGAYRVVCKEGVDTQTIVNNCIGSEQLDLLILCVSESRAGELLTGEGLRVDSERLTVILVNRSDDHSCPLYRRVSNDEIDTSTNVTVTVRYLGVDQLAMDASHHPDINSSRNADASLALLALFSICLISAVLGIWIVVGCLRSYFKQSQRPQVRTL